MNKQHRINGVYIVVFSYLFYHTALGKMSYSYVLNIYPKNPMQCIVIYCKKDAWPFMSKNSKPVYMASIFKYNPTYRGVNARSLGKKF